MAPFPLALSEILGHWNAYIVYLIIGFAFGYILEIAGFGNSLKLSSQFYFKDQTVLKVMFSAIIVAMVLIFFTSGLGLLDYNLIWVNPTYLWPGIVGGLIMGVGFIVGGFCPGTSLVAAATLKIDGLFFALGTFFGIFLFGETVPLFADFWNSSYMGRFTLQDWLGLETGTVVLLVVLMALFMFWGAEQLERIIGKKDPAAAPKWRYVAAGGLVVTALAVILIGQPTTADKWAAIASEKEVVLTERKVQIHPAELLNLMHDNKIKTVVLDVRSETDYNLFHILDAQHTPVAEIPALIATFHLEPANTVFVVTSNDETAATEAWKTLTAESVPNVYILEGGVNNWLALFAGAEIQAADTTQADDVLRYRFNSAVGSRYTTANPNPEAFELEYTPKVELGIKRGPTGGGCG